MLELDRGVSNPFRNEFVPVIQIILNLSIGTANLRKKKI
jgi:hypothetical protein